MSASNFRRSALFFAIDNIERTYYMLRVLFNECGGKKGRWILITKCDSKFKTQTVHRNLILIEKGHVMHVRNALLVVVLVCVGSIFGGCGTSITSSSKKGPLTVEHGKFGETADGRPVELYTLTNANNMKVGIMNYGAAITSIIVPDRSGKFADVALGYDTFADYLNKVNPYFGGIVGRFGNRIGKGKFTLDGVEYTLATNNNGNHLHGGNVGFDKVLWTAASFKTKDTVGVKLQYLSRDGEEGYPGNLNITVIYTLTNNNELKIDYAAAADKATPVNLTQHGYWNLAGQGNGDILGHVMMINADRITPVDEGLIP
ncbi:MAG TPA: aldose epimerase family protein, partial [Methylococcales bacterium]